MTQTTRYAATLIGAILVCSCSPWPPDKQALSNHFDEHRKEIETLQFMLRESGFDQVSVKGGKYVWGTEYSDDSADGPPAREGEPTDADKWIELFDSTELESIFVNDGGGVSLPVYYFTSHPGIGSHASYVNGPSAPSHLQECKKEFAEVDCGFCMVTLDTDWWLTFGWWPSDLTDKEFLTWQDGEISEHEYYQLQDQIYDQCIADGGTLIGSRETRIR